MLPLTAELQALHLSSVRGILMVQQCWQGRLGAQATVVTSLAKLAGTITDSNIYYNNEKSEPTWEMYNYVNILELPSDIVFVFHNIVSVKIV